MNSQEIIADKVYKQLQYKDKYNKLETTTVRGKKLIVGYSEDESARYFYPMDSKDILTFRTLRAAIEHSKQECLTLAIHDSDSTTVFYNTRLKIHPPNIPACNEEPSVIAQNEEI